ncbi:hypothetical protein D3C81_979050 [compost metagenome]
MTGAGKWFFLVVGVIAVGAGTVILVNRGGTSVEASVRDDVPRRGVNPGVVEVTSVDSRAAITANAGPMSSGGDGVRAKLEKGYTWNSARPGDAANEEDAAWFNSRGYPGPEVYEYLHSIPQGELKRLADAGNVSAMSIYAQSLSTVPGNRAEILSLLHRGASTGSVYSLKMGGDIFSAYPDYRDPVMSLVYYQLQARAGDHSGYVQSYIAKQQIKPEQALLANVMTEQMWKNFAGTQLLAQSANVRPGYDEFVATAISSNNNGG